MDSFRYHSITIHTTRLFRLLGWGVCIHEQREEKVMMKMILTAATKCNNATIELRCDDDDDDDDHDVVVMGWVVCLSSHHSARNKLCNE